MIYVYIENNKFKKQIKYVFNNVFYILGLSYKFIVKIEEIKEIKSQDILFIYSNKIVDNNFKNIIYIKSSNLLFCDDYLKKTSMPKNVKRYALDKSIKSIENLISLYNPNSDLYINKCFNDKKVIETNIDFISDIFFMLTRYEEVVNREVTENEKYNRFSAKESVAFKNLFLNRPIVNEYIEIVWEWIDELNLGYKRKHWWGDKDFSACLTHDVDVIQRYKSLKNTIRPMINLIIKHKKPQKIFNVICNYIQTKKDYKKDPFWTFNYIMDTEKKYGFTSSFYFMSGGTSEIDSDYEINDRRIKELIIELKRLDNEVGYHASFNSYNNFELMNIEKDKLDKVSTDYGCRQHCLRFSVPVTWRIQEKLGLLYDTTLTYADCEGFRCGICFPFKPYDLLEDRVMDVWEIPLTVMEVSLRSVDYGNFTPNEGFMRIKQLIDTVKLYNGVFTFLWHNSSFTEDWNKWVNVYEKTIEYLSQCNCMGESGKKLIESITIND